MRIRVQPIEAERFHWQNSIPGSQDALSAAVDKGQQPQQQQQDGKRHHAGQKQAAGRGLRVVTWLDGSWAGKRTRNPSYRESHKGCAFGRYPPFRSEYSVEKI